MACVRDPIKLVTVAAACLTVGLLTATGCKGKKKEPQLAPLRLSVVRHDENTQPWLQRCEQEFEAARPDTDLIVSIVEPSQLQGSGAPSSDGPPDITIVDDAGLACLVAGCDESEARSLDASQYYPEYGADFLDIAVKMSARDGRAYGLPVGLSLQGLYYNKGLLRAAGKKPPRTWDELLDVAKATTRPEEGVYGFAFQSDDRSDAQLWYAFACSAGGDVIAPGGKWAGSSPEAVAALHFLADLVGKHGVVDPGSPWASGGAVVGDFADGKVAMMVGPTKLRERLAASAEPVEYGVVPIPGKAQPVSLATAEYLVVLQNSGHREAAAQFAAFFFEDDRHLDWAKTFGVLPTKKSVAEPPETAPSAEPVEPLFEEVPLREDPSWKMQFDLLPSARFVPICRNRGQIDEAVGAALSEVYAGSKSPDAAVAQLDAEVGALLGEGSAGDSGT